MSDIFRFTIHFLQFMALCGLVGFLWILPPKLAGRFGKMFGQKVGPHLPLNRRVLKNLRKALPDHPAEKLAQETWGELAQTVTEIPHLPTLLKTARIVGKENLLLAQTQPIIFCAAHLGQWEAPMMVAAREGIPLTLMYRPANNPMVDWLVQKLRKRQVGLSFFPKRRDGLKAFLKTLKQGGSIGLLIDQRVGEGWEVPFFGYMAPSSSTPVELAKKMNCAIVSVQTIRKGYGEIEIIFHPPIKVTDPRESLFFLHSQLESWIRQHPSQWFWAHRRWG